MSIRQRRLAHATGFLALALSLAAVTATVSTRATSVAPAAAAHDAHVFVPTRAALPSKDEEAAPTF